MIVAGTRLRALPAPPHVVATSLVTPDADPARRWLALLPDEVAPRIVEQQPGLVVWSSLWPSRPDALVRFELASERSGGTALRWTLLVEEPLPDASKRGHLRKRINQLIHADLRRSYGQ